MHTLLEARETLKKGHHLTLLLKSLCVYKSNYLEERLPVSVWFIMSKLRNWGSSGMHHKETMTTGFSSDGVRPRLFEAYLGSKFHLWQMVIVLIKLHLGQPEIRYTLADQRDIWGYKEVTWQIKTESHLWESKADMKRGSNSHPCGYRLSLQQALHILIYKLS